MGALDDYRVLIGRSLHDASSRVLGDPERLRAAAEARGSLARYVNRPVGFIREVLGEQSWQAGRAILRAVRDHHRVLSCGCRKSTKSHTSAQGVLWMGSTAPTRVVVTSATYTQVRENIFARVRKLHAQSRIPLPGVLGVTSWRMDPTWYAIGISTNKPGNIQGYHGDVKLDAALEYDDEQIDEDSLLPPDQRAADDDAARSERDAVDVVGEELYRQRKAADRSRLFFVLDEGAEMRADLIETILGSLIGDNVYCLIPFNPTFQPDSGHPVSRFLQNGGPWHRIHIAGREPPGEMHGPAAGEPGSLFDECWHGVPKDLMPDAWVSERLADWGPDSAMAACHVYGLPAATDRERQFIPFRILAARFDAEFKDDGRSSSRHIGWDVAGSEGGDWNVAQLWVKGHLIDEERWRWSDTISSSDRVLELTRKWGVGGEPIPSRNVHVDATGGSMGKTCADYMRSKGFRVDAVDFGGEAQGEWQRLIGPDMYFVNRKAELLWVLRCALDKGLGAIAKRWADTIRQAQWYTYKEVARANGTALQCAETTEQIKAAFGRSPDNLSAAMLAWSRSGQKPLFASAGDTRRLSRLLGG